MKKRKFPVNNAFYDGLSHNWHDAYDHPIALLRAENALRNPWIQAITKEKLGKKKCRTLDIGCGAGFLTNYLAMQGHEVYGIDLSERSLQIARQKDVTKSVHYQRGCAYELPFLPEHFDVTCTMDLLQHVEEPAKVIKEVARVLKPQGLFFFHTFNRNWLSYLMMIKGIEWCFYNAPPHMHVYSLFIKPEELKEICSNHSLQIEVLVGVTPNMGCSSFWKMVLTRKVDEYFHFSFTPSLKMGYSGYAFKNPKG